jgi:hypothetical protein
MGHRWQYGADELHASYLRLQTHSEYVLFCHCNNGCTNAPHILRCTPLCMSCFITHAYSFTPYSLYIVSFLWQLSIARSCALLIYKWWLDDSFLFEAVKGQIQMATGWWYLRQMEVVMRHLRGKKILMFRSALWPRTLPITSNQAKKS